jgi:hypothetical protein
MPVDDCVLERVSTAASFVIITSTTCVRAASMVARENDSDQLTDRLASRLQCSVVST